MALHTDEARSSWLRFALVFLAGLLVGWWLIGWWLWPVTYTNALPQDLKAAERDQYLTMVAESFAANGDLNLARQRLGTWPEAELAEDLANLQTRLESQNPAQAALVQRLAGALGANAQQPITPPPASSAEGSSSLSATLGRICGAGLWVLLVLLGILAIAYLWRRWRAAQPGDALPPIGGMGPGGRGIGPARSVSDFGENTENNWSLSQPEDFERDAQEPVATPRRWSTGTSEGEASGSRPDAYDDRPLPPSARQEPATRPTQPPAADSSSPESLWRPVVPPSQAPQAPSQARPGQPSASSGGPSKIGEFMAAYHMGEPDYDEAFDIHDGSGQYVGQCGLGLTMPVGRANDQAAALQVWLWDTNDPDTQVKVLMSEGAYRDTALRDQLAGEHPAMPVRTRTEFELETYNLLLRGIVEKLDYAEQEPANGIFAEMVVRLRAYKK